MRSLKRELFSFVTNTCLSIMFRRITKPATIQFLAITIRLYQLPNIFQSTSENRILVSGLFQPIHYATTAILDCWHSFVRSYHEFEWCT